MTINKGQKASEKPITWRNLNDDPSIRKALLDIINSAELNQREFDRYIGWNVDDDDRIINIWKILTYQYSRKLSEMLKKKDRSDVVGFLNRFVHSYLEFIDAGRPEYAPISPEELNKFRQLAADTDKVPIETLAETAPVLTTNSYLKMCRLVYDATSLWKYPDDISTEHIYCKERVLNGSSILHIDRDSPEEFARSFYPTYHYEELWFGGPALYIGDESVRSGKSCYTTPRIFGKWTGWIGSHYYDSVKLYRSVKMYIALRKNGYPIYCRNYEEIYNEIIKLDYLRK